jgi:hypothetical protein
MTPMPPPHPGPRTSRIRAAVLMLAGLLAPAGPAQAQVERLLPPVEAAAADTGWQQFHKRLAGAVESRDLRFLLSIVDPKIRNSFDKPEGTRAFVEQWDLEPAKAKDSPVWRELRAMLRFAPAAVESPAGERMLCLPYVAVRWPPTIDPFLFGAVVVADAPVFDRPSALATIVRSLSHDIVGVEDWELPDENPKITQRWVRVALKDRVGYVAEEHMRSPVEARACFARRGATWRMVSLTVGGG